MDNYSKAVEIVRALITDGYIDEDLEIEAVRTVVLMLDSMS